MNQKWDGIERRKSLRANAEALVANLSSEAMRALPTEVLLHELLVHKIELEMQLEELRSAHLALQEARDRYRDLYEYAPTSYIIINREDQISEINLTGAALLGVDRDQLISQRFSKFVASQDSDRWYLLHRSMMDSNHSEKQAFGLQMMSADGGVFHAHLDCLRRDFPDATPMLHITLTDVSKSRPVENK